MFRIRKPLGAWSEVTIAVFLGAAGTLAATANADPQQRVPLYLFWNGIDDNYSSVNSSISGYQRIRVEAQILQAPWPGTVPLQLYFHAGRRDSLLAATPETENAAKQAGYTWLRTEGHVFQGPIPGTVALKTYWNSARGDHANVASAQGEVDQQKSGYTFVRNEGYAFAANDPDFGADKVRLEIFESPSVPKSETAFKTSFVVHPDLAKTGCRYSWIGTIFKTNPHDAVLTICDTGVVGPGCRYPTKPTRLIHAGCQKTLSSNSVRHRPKLVRRMEKPLTWASATHRVCSIRTPRSLPFWPAPPRSPPWRLRSI